MYQRLFAAVLLVCCALLAISAWGYHAPFSYEPVGPRAYPLLLLALMSPGALYLLIKPASASHSDEPPMDRHVLGKVSACVALLLIYAAVFESLGFIPASVVFGAAMARLYGGSWSISAIAGLVMGVGLYLLFDKALDVPLPLGILAVLEN